MDLEASAGRNVKKSYFDHCEHLKIRARTQEEAAWMASLVRVLTDGGRLTITPNGREPVDVAFGSVWEKSSSQAS